MATKPTKARSARCLQFDLVAGTTANTNIAVTGIATEDELLCCIQLEGTGTWGAAPANRLAEASITSAGNIQLTTTNTTNKLLLLVWDDLSA